MPTIPSLRPPVHWRADWSRVDAMEYLGPFLDVVRSAETSGPITAMALSSINKLLLYEIIGTGTAWRALSLSLSASWLPPTLTVAHACS